MALTPVEDVWGVGSRLTRRLKVQGIHTALDLANADPAQIRGRFNVVLERTVRELRGEFCSDLEPVAPTKQQIMVSRSFGQRVTTFRDMREAVSAYVERAVEKLRIENREARSMMVFICTSAFAKDKPGYSNSLTAQLPLPSADTRIFLEAANRLLNMIWRDGYEYSKAGVLLADFYAPGAFPGDLFRTEQGTQKSSELMAVVDQINRV